MNDNLQHILDKSTCLSSRQMKDYIIGCITKDECHAIEHHLNNCALCSEAIDGIRSADAAALEELAGMDKQFFRNRIVPPAVIEAKREAAKRTKIRRPPRNHTMLIALIATSLLIIIMMTVFREFVRL